MGQKINRPPKDDMLNVVEVLMQAEAQPMHYKQVASMMLEMGLWGYGGREPDQVLYSRIHNDIRRNGDNSPFRFLGDGVFCASTVKCVDEVAIPAEEIIARMKPRDPEEDKMRRKPTETKPDYDMRIASYTETRACGNCTHLNFENAYIISQRRGFCHNYTNSGRCGVAVEAKPCDFWERRSDAQRHADRRERDSMLEAWSGKKKR